MADADYKTVTVTFTMLVNADANETETEMAIYDELCMIESNEHGTVDITDITFQPGIH